MENEKILLTNGDSWTFGSEIMAPEFLAGPHERGYGMANRYKKNHHDWEKRNDYYRVPRIWPTMLANNIGYKSINLAWPARSNDTIYHTTVGWLLENYIIPRKNTDNLLVIIGWSSPERKNILIKDQETIHLQTFWPAMADTNFYPSTMVIDYFKFYVNNLWLEQEYISRYIEQNHMLQCFCKSNGIRYYCFNSFYQTPGTGPNDWKELNITDTLESWKSAKIKGWFDPSFSWEKELKRLENLWKSVDESSFILKDQKNGSFKSHVQTALGRSKSMINWHPSPDGHEEWARFLKEILDKENKKANQGYRTSSTNRFMSMITRGKQNA